MMSHITVPILTMQIFCDLPMEQPLKAEIASKTLKIKLLTNRFIF